MDSNDAREPSTRPEGVNDTKGHPATSRLEGVTNLDFNKQDSADGIPTTSLRIRGGGPKSKGPGTRPSRFGSFLSSPEGTAEDTEHATPGKTVTDTGAVLEPPFAGAPHHATPDPPGPASADPTRTLPPLFELGASSSHTAPEVPLGTVPAPSVLGAPPEPTPEPGVPPSPSAPSAIAPDPTMPTLVTTTASLPTPPEPPLLDALRESTAAHHITLSTLTLDLSEHITKSRADSLTHRDALDRIVSDLESSRAELLAQRDATNRERLAQRDATDTIALGLKSSIKTIDGFRDELRLFLAEVRQPRAASLHAENQPLPDETEPLPTRPGASRFTPPPWSRGRSLRDTTRQPTRLAHRQRDAPGKLGDSSSTSHDKRHATYCRKLDIASAPASKKYAIIAVVTINKVTTVCATDQFRTWTLSRPQSTTVTIETAIWSLLHVNILDARDIFAEFDPVFCDFRYRIQHGETTDDTLDGILRLTFPDSRDSDPQTSVDGIAQTLRDMHFYDVATTYVQSNAAVKAAHIAHSAPIDFPIRAIERKELRSTLLKALMCHPYSEDTHNPRLGDFTMNPTSSSSEHRRTLWGRLPQMDIAAALPQWTAGLSIQAFQQLLITTIHTDTASLIADLLHEQDPLPTILAAILRRHHDSNEFTMLVTADIAEHLKSELAYYKENYASIVVNAQRNPADPRQHRSFLSVLCVCLAAIRSAFLGTSRDGALHSEARQFLTQLRITMYSTSDVEYLLEANAYWLRYSQLWGPVLLFSLCDGGQIQTLLPSVTARLSPPMQERILLFFGDIAYRLRVAHDAGKLPPAFASQLSSILTKPLLLHSTIPLLSIYAEFSCHGEQTASLFAMHQEDMFRGNHNHRIAHPADLAFVGKTGALIDYWPAMIRHVLGHHNRVLVAPAAQIALVAWDDIYSNIE